MDAGSWANNPADSTVAWYVYPLRLLGQGRAKAPEITDKHTG